jgi:hypothetical protein
MAKHKVKGTIEFEIEVEATSADDAEGIVSDLIDDEELFEDERVRLRVVDFNGLPVEGS